MAHQLSMLLGSVSINAAEHPNKMRFKGVLVRLDEPSTRPPNGAEGHRIYVPADVAKKRLGTLVGMGLNYAEQMDGHAQRRKVGVVEKAYIDGRDLWVEGHIWKHDFPEALKDLKQNNLGMSMEIGQVEVDDINADVWVLNDFYFLGATILFRNAAAYNRTQAIAAQAKLRSDTMKTKTTTVKKPAAVATIDAQAIAQIATQAAVEGVSKHFAGTFTKQTKLLAQLAGQMEDMRARVTSLEATGVEAQDEEEAPEEQEAAIANDGSIIAPVPKMTTKKVHAQEDVEEEVEEEEDDDEIESEGVDTGDLEEMGPDTSGGDLGEPGQQNEDDENKGSRTTVKDEIGKNVNKAVTGSVLASLRRQVARLTQQTAGLAKENKQLKKKLAATSKQVTAAANNMERRSRPIHPDVNGLLIKAGVDPNTMHASQQKLSVQEVDAMLASSLPNLDVVSRMTLKNKFLEMGMMEEGAINRGIGIKLG